MIFVEFTKAGSGKKRYFVGKDWPSIFADTKGGTEFGFVKMDGHRIISEERMREIHKTLNFKYLQMGIDSVRQDQSDSYLIY